MNSLLVSLDLPYIKKWEMNVLSFIRVSVYKQGGNEWFISYYSIRIKRGGGNQ